jgi:hypothetical protein
MSVALDRCDESRAVSRHHRGQLLIEGNTTACVRFRHADGRAYGETVEPRVLDAHAKTFGALRTLGFLRERGGPLTQLC